MSGATSLMGRWSCAVDINYGTFRGCVRHMLAAGEYVLGRHQAWTCAPTAPVRRLVFVCLGNINRSAFGAEVARSLGLPTVSIGLSTTTGAPATPMACVQARCQGFDLAAHLATDHQDYTIQPGDLLLAMEVRHAKQLVARGVPSDSIRLLGAWASPMRLHLHDPHTLSSAYFATCFTLIESAVRNLSAELGQAQSKEAGHAGPPEL